MRKFILALGAVAALSILGVSLPVTTPAEAQSVVIKTGDHDRGMHRGRTRGHHYGWDRGRRNHQGWDRGHHRNKVVVIKRFRHHN